MLVVVPAVQYACGPLGTSKHRSQLASEPSGYYNTQELVWGVAGLGKWVTAIAASRNPGNASMPTDMARPSARVLNVRASGEPGEGLGAGKVLGPAEQAQDLDEFGA